MMKALILLILILILLAGLANGQSFEGTLTYKHEVEISENMAKMGITGAILRAKGEKEGSWFDTIRISYKEGNYYSISNNSLRYRTIYTSETNKTHGFQDGEADYICLVTDAGVDLSLQLFGKAPTITKLDTVAIVNGISCSIVRVEWTTGIADYYYNPDMYKIDASFFDKHILDGWAGFLKMSNALPLKMIKSVNGLMITTTTLVSSSTEKINADIFTIPTLIPDETLNILKVGSAEMMRIKK